MEYSKSLLTVVLGVIFVMTFTACDQNKNKGIKVGSLTSDSQSIISTSALNGVQLGFSVQNISPSPYSTTQQMNSYYGYTQQAAGSYKADIIIVGTPLVLVFTPTIYNFSNSFYGIYTGSNMAQTYYGNGYIYGNIYYEGKCSTANCETLFLNIIITTSNGAEFRQIGIKKSMTTNRITALVEHSGNYSSSSSYKTTDQIIRELTTNSSL